MITAFEVGSVFKIVDQATPTLLRISAELAKMEGKVITIGAELAKIGRMRLTGLNNALGKVDAGMGKVVNAASTMTGRLTADFAKVDARIAQTTANVNILGSALRQAGQAGGGMGRLTGPGHPRPGGGGGAGGGGTGGRGGSGHAGQAGLGLGIFGFFGAVEVGHGLKEVLKHASELEHVQQQMLQGGFKQVDINKALSASWDQARKHGLSVAKVMGDIKELALPFGSVEHAVEFIEPLEKMRIVLNAVSEGKGNQAAESVYKMARTGELKGLQSPEDFVSYFQNMTKVISASGGKVGPQDFMQFTKYGKLASMGWDEEFFTKYAPTLMQTMGASTAGTSLMSLFGTLVQGTVTKRSLGRMDDLGLIGDPSKIIYDNKGDPKGFNPGAITGTDQLVRNPFKWAQEILLPLLEKKYGDIGVEENKQRAIEDLGGLFGNRNSGAAVAELALRGKTFNKDAGLIENARGIEGADKLLGEDPMAVAAKLKGAWGNLLTALGGPGVETAIAAMNGLAAGITSVTKWATEHPAGAKLAVEAMEGLAIGLGGLAVVGVAAGAALLAPGGAMALALSALAGFATSIVVNNWDEIKNGFVSALQTISDAIITAWNKVRAVGDWLGNNQPGMSNGQVNPFFQPGSYTGSGFGGAIHKANIGANSYTGVPSVGGLNVSPTAGGGSFHPALLDAARAAGANRITSLNDAYHAGTGSAHARGLAIDMTGSPGAIMSGTRAAMAAAGLVEGRDFKMIDEYAHPSARATGGHVHFQFNSKDAADAFQKWKGSSGQNPGPPPKHDQMVQVDAHFHVDGRKIASAVSRHQAAMARYPSSIGSMDGHGHWVPPATTQTDAA